MIKSIKNMIKRINCKHEYRQICKVLGINKMNSKEVELCITYQCVHCCKEVDINIFDNCV